MLPTSAARPPEPGPLRPAELILQQPHPSHTAGPSPGPPPAAGSMDSCQGLQVLFYLVVPTANSPTSPSYYQRVQKAVVLEGEGAVLSIALAAI